MARPQVADGGTGL